MRSNGDKSDVRPAKNARTLWSIGSLYDWRDICLYLGNRSCSGHSKWDLMPGKISSKDVVLRAVYPGSDHTRGVQT